MKPLVEQRLAQLKELLKAGKIDLGQYIALENIALYEQLKEDFGEEVDYESMLRAILGDS